MKGETVEQVAERMRAIAASMSDKGDAAEIVRYADGLVRRPTSGSYDEPPLGLWPTVSADARADDN